MTQYLKANGGSAIGDINPLLYRIAAGRTAARLPRRDPRRQRGRHRGPGLRPGQRTRHPRRRQPRPQSPHPPEDRPNEHRAGNRRAATPGMVECQVCQTDVPAGEYCGLCGIPLTEHRADGPGWLRASAFSASPGEHLLTTEHRQLAVPPPVAAARACRSCVGLWLIVAALVATTLVPPARRADHRRRARPAPAVPASTCRSPTSHRDIPTGHPGADGGARHRPRRRLGAVDGRRGRAGLRRRRWASASPGPAILRDGLGVPIGGMLAHARPRRAGAAGPAGAREKRWTASPSARSAR